MNDMNIVHNDVEKCKTEINKLSQNQVVINKWVADTNFEQRMVETRGDINTLGELSKQIPENQRQIKTVAEKLCMIENHCEKETIRMNNMNDKIKTFDQEIEICKRSVRENSEKLINGQSSIGGHDNSIPMESMKKKLKDMEEKLRGYDGILAANEVGMHDIKNEKSETNKKADEWGNWCTNKFDNIERKIKFLETSNAHGKNSGSTPTVFSIGDSKPGLSRNYADVVKDSYTASRPKTPGTSSSSKIINPPPGLGNETQHDAPSSSKPPPNPNPQPGDFVVTQEELNAKPDAAENGYWLMEDNYMVVNPHVELTRNPGIKKSRFFFVPHFGERLKLESQGYELQDGESHNDKLLANLKAEDIGGKLADQRSISSFVRILEEELSTRSRGRGISILYERRIFRNLVQILFTTQAERQKFYRSKIVREDITSTHRFKLLIIRLAEMLKSAEPEEYLAGRRYHKFTREGPNENLLSVVERFDKVICDAGKSFDPKTAAEVIDQHHVLVEKLGISDEEYLEMTRQHNSRYLTYAEIKETAGIQAEMGRIKAAMREKRGNQQQIQSRIDAFHAEPEVNKDENEWIHDNHIEQEQESMEGYQDWNKTEEDECEEEIEMCVMSAEGLIPFQGFCR